MGAEKKPGDAAPAAGAENSAGQGGGEFSADTMKAVFAKFGKKLEIAKTEGSRGDAEQGAAKTETPEQKAAREAAGAAGADPDAAARAAETPEQKAEREAAEAAAAAEAETPEEKATREAEEAAARETPEAKAAAEQHAETEKLVRAKLKDLPEAQRKVAQSIINERIGHISAKAKAEVETATAETKRLGDRVVELTTELDEAREGGGQQVVIQGVHPAMLAETPAQLDRMADELDRQEDMLERFRETGIEADEARGIPGYTAEQVRARLRELARERERVLPKARELLTQRATADAALKAQLPELFDVRTEEYRAAAQLRKLLPEIRRLPNAAEFVAKFVLGTKVLAERQAAAAKKPGDGKNGAAAAAAGGAGAPEKKATQPPPTRKAPRAPGDGAAGNGSVLDDPRSQQPDAAAPMKQFANTRSREDLKASVRALVFR
jgi:hypothetical protein